MSEPSQLNDWKSGPTYQGMRWLGIGLPIFFTLLFVGMRMRPVQPYRINNAIILCNERYARARSAADSAAVDDRRYEAGRIPPWYPPLPTCDELKREGLLTRAN